VRRELWQDQGDLPDKIVLNLGELIDTIWISWREQRGFSILTTPMAFPQ